MNRNNNFSRSGKPNDLNNRASHSNTTRNKNVDNIEMISIPDVDYDEEPEHQNVEYDMDEDYRLGPEDGLERTVNDMRPVPNRFKPNDYQINELLSRRPKQLTMRHARKIALQLGLLNQINSNQGFEPDYDHDNSSSYSVSLESKRLCWARKCKKDNCETHLRRGLENDDSQIEFHLFNNQRLNQVMDGLHDFWSSIKIWSRNLRKIEAFYGTGIVSYFHFLRWLLFINFLIALSVILLIIIPQTSFATKYYENNITYQTNYSDKPLEIALDFLQGTGYLESSITFIGHYDRKVSKLPLLGWDYKITLAYIACTLFYFFFCFVLMLRYTTDGMKDTLLAEQHQQYSPTIFCGWDYCTGSEKRFKFKQSSIAMEIKNCQEVDSRKEIADKRTSRERLKLYSIRTFITLIVIAILGASFYAIYLVTQTSAEYVEESKDTMTFIFIKEYSPTLTIFALYVIAPIIFEWLITFEKYDSQAFEVKITLMRMVFLRMASVIVLLISLLERLEKNKKEVNSKNQCWENYIGQSFYKLMVGDLILETFSILIFDSLRKYIVGKSAFVKKFLGFQKFDIPRNVLSLVYIQALCWLGTFYCPLMPIICVVRLFILFYLQKFTLRNNCSPPDQAYRASRSNIIFISILIISYFITAIPIAYSIGSSERVPSPNCSPFGSYKYMWEPIEELIGKKSEVKIIADLITSSASTLGVTFFLCLLTYYYYVRGLMHKKMIGAVHSELKEIANDRIYLIDQLSLINIKQELNSQQRTSF